MGKNVFSLFCVMNEMSQVIGWQFTKGTSFENIRALLNAMKTRFDKKKQFVQVCYIDNCCSWKRKVQSVFSANCIVRLDLFHALSRVVTEMPKRHPFHAACSQDFSKILRDSDDIGLVRKKATPNPEVITDNLDNFIKKWENIAYEERHLT